MTTFAERLLNLREKAVKKRQEVADDLGISRASLEYYEKDKRKPDIDVLLKLADYYNVSTDYLLGLTAASTTDKDVQYICDYTGLSEDAIDTLHSCIKIMDEEAYKLSVDFVSDLIEMVKRFVFQLRNGG